MRALAETLRLVEAGVFLTLAVLATSRWRRTRERGSAWLIPLFASVGVINVLALTLPTTLTRNWQIEVGRVILWLIIAFPYTLYRFGSTFAPVSRRVEWSVTGVCVGLAGWTAVLPLGGTHPGLEMKLYGLAIGVQWVGIGAHFALRMWQARRGLPGVARRRAEMLAGAAVLMGSALLLVSIIPPATHPEALVLGQSWAILAGAAFLAGFAPPRWLLRGWRKRDDALFQRALVSLVRANNPDEIIATLLPQIVTLTGAEVIRLLDESGSIVGEARGRDGTGSREEIRVSIPGGALALLASSYTPFLDQDSTAVLAHVGTLLGLSIERARAHLGAETARDELAAAQRLAGIGSWQWDLSTNTFEVSAMLREIMELDEDTPLTYESFLSRTDAAERARQIERTQSGLAHGPGSFESEYWVILPSGAEKALHTRSALTADAEGRPLSWLGTTQDVTTQRQLEARLQHQANHDTLTGLPNRTLLQEHLDDALARARVTGAALAVLFIDVDRFKVINDTLGHNVGDAVLQTTARRLQEHVRAGDWVARFGGDEFVILCEGFLDRADVLRRARELRKSMHIPVSLGESELVLTLSTGIYIVEDPSIDATMLLRDADAAMYRAKRAGGGCEVVFEPRMREHLVERLALEVDLRRAIEARSLGVAYQPIVDLRTCEVTGVEALVRWSHPERGMVSPAELIEVAEETGLIGAVGAYVLEQACEALAGWNGEHPDRAPLRLAVNFSGLQVTQQRVHEHLAGVIQRTGIDAGQLELEITESVLMRDAEESLSSLTALKALGVRISIDDFGTGYSSLSYLKRFPVDTLKIDQSFIRGLFDDAEDYAIASAVVSLAWALGLDTVAEGIEEAQHIGALTQLGCTQGQGYYFSRPVSAAEISALLQTGTGGNAPTLPLEFPAQRTRANVSAETSTQPERTAAGS